MGISNANNIHDSVLLYRQVEVENSQIDERSIIGDFSRIRNSHLGKYIKIDRNNLLLGVDFGDYSYTGPFDMIFRCKLGRFCSISYGVTIGPPEHDYKKISTHPFVYDEFYNIAPASELLQTTKFDKELEIGNDVWVGCNATILRGVRVGDGAIIAANALVNKDVPPYAIVAGVPAKVVKYRFSPDIISALLELKWWEWETERIRKNIWLFKSDLSLAMILNYKNNI